MEKKIKCFYCKGNYYKKNLTHHLKSEHNLDYYELIEEEINEDYTLLISDNGVLKEDKKEYSSSSSEIKNYEPKDFKLEATTIWSFPDRGKWATHSGKYRGNWSPYIPRNIILRYSQKKDLVLDQFLGSGTTLVEAKLLERKGIGVDINPEAIKIANENLMFNIKAECESKIYNADSRNLDFIPDSSIDLICTHPPYSNIIKYSEDISEDMSHLDVDDFIKEMKKVSDESFRVLKEDKYCAILIGDMRQKKHVVPLGFMVMQTFLQSGFVLKEIIIKEQHNCKATGFWHKKSVDFNFLLLAHEYLFVFRKP